MINEQTFYAHMGRTIFRLRCSRGFSRAYVAEALGISAAAMSQLEAGRRRINTLELIKLAQLFKVGIKKVLLTPQRYGV